VACGFGAPREARHFVRSTLDSWCTTEPAIEDVILDAELLVSEVVTVSTRHSGDVHATVSVTATTDTVRVEIADPYRGFAPEHDDFEELIDAGIAATAYPPDGIGLNILDRVAPRWGVDLGTGGKAVWFELGGPGHTGR